MDKYTWNLKAIYQDNDIWQKDFDKVSQKVLEIDAWDKNILKSGSFLLETLKKEEDLERNIFKLYSYAKLKKDANGLDTTANQMFMSIEKLYETYAIKTTFIGNELKKLNKKKLQVLYQECSELKDYDYLFKVIIKNKKHVLSLKEEKIINASSNIRSSFESVFEKLDYVDAKFDKVGDKELDHSTYSMFLKDKNQNIRKEAWEKYHLFYKEHANTLSECLINNIKNDVFESNIRKFNSPLQMSLNNDNIKEQVYTDLITSVHNNLPLLHKYYDLKGKANGIKHQHMYDLYVKSGEYNRKFTFDEAEKIVKESIKVLGSDYANNYAKAFSEHWIDVYYRKGKYSGAYSSGTYDTYPYVLLNFKDDFESIETLAHEMGHSMHSYYSCKNNPYHLSSYPIFLAEIASNVNELLLFDYMLKTSQDKNEQKYILETILDSFRGSIFRQTQFAEFEKILHDNYEKNSALTTEEITNIYYDLNKLYYGDNIISDDLIRYEGLRIPHFYSSFYVYKYATGLAIAYIFASRILNKEKQSLENYLKFLSIGGTDYPLNVLKSCGIDFSCQIVDEAMGIFNKYLQEYEELLGSEENGNK